MKVLCVFGQYQYGQVGRGEGIEYTSFIPALRNLGHEVRHFESWDRGCYADFSELNRRLLDEVEAFRPDVMLTVQMEYEIWLETLDAIRARGDVATVSWAADDSWKYREVSRFIGPAYHAMTTTYDYVLQRYRADGIRHVLLTQWAASSSRLEEPLPSRECTYQVSFVGAAHGDRRHRVERLRAAGIDVACFGHGWETGPVDTETFARIVRESVISLNFANSRGLDQLKARCFEVPGAGGFLLTQRVHGLDRYYVPDVEVGCFSSDDELPERIRYFLDHPDERDRIAWAGHRRTAAEHTYERRLDEVIRFALLARVAAPSVQPPDLVQALAVHRLSPALRLLRRLLESVGRILFGPERGLRAARRFMFEASWRLAGRHTFTAAGWPGRMFPDC
jgi:spore maturation protein CgeB